MYFMITFGIFLTLSHLVYNKILIALMRIFPKTSVLTTKSHFDVKERMRQYEAWWSLKLGSGKTRISAIDCALTACFVDPPPSMLPSASSREHRQYRGSTKHTVSHWAQSKSINYFTRHETTAGRPSLPNKQ